MPPKQNLKNNPKPQAKKARSRRSKTSEQDTKAYELDASGKILGRLSTEVATILRGKNKPTFVPYKPMGDKVIITNASKIKVTGAKLTGKIYYKHSGYMGHLKSQNLGEKLRKNPAEVLRKSIYGMLPKNKLRKIWMRNLTIYNGAKPAKGGSPELNEVELQGEKNAGN